MILSIWRYSHLTIAIILAVFLLVASITGTILAIEPLSKSLANYTIPSLEKHSLAKTIIALEKEYKEVSYISVDEYKNVSASVLTNTGSNKTFYINPKTGKPVGKPKKRLWIFKSATSLHRSLFLKTTGRFIMGVVSFLLLLTSITGFFLLYKRQGNLKRMFSKISKVPFASFYHTVFSRVFFIPVVIISLSAIFLSFDKFNLLSTKKVRQEIKNNKDLINVSRSVKDFPIFKNTIINDVKKLDFPFTKDEEDVFYLKLKNKEYLINQFSGAIISEWKKPLTAKLLNLSLLLHTGIGTSFWAFILLTTSIALLFFIYSGFSISIRRIKNKKKTTAIFDADECEYIILVGSETGSTFNFAITFYNELIALGKKAFLTNLNQYKTYNNLKHLLIFTSTYGEGEAPGNASKFESKFRKTKVNTPVKFSVIGFGSLAYRQYCKYALDINKLLLSNPYFTEVISPYKVNNQSFEDFKAWTIKWGQAIGIEVNINQLEKQKNTSEEIFTVVKKSNLNVDNTFLLRLSTNSKSYFKSGDLLAITPYLENTKRFYSIAKYQNDILLSIKKHEFGICSNYLNSLPINTEFKGSFLHNNNFNFPERASEIIMIANGTGIIPFIGLLHENNNRKKTHLFWGGRTQESLEIYLSYIQECISNKKLSNFEVAFSKVQMEKIYVQDLLAKHLELITRCLSNKGVVMVCGSLAMQKEVLFFIDKVCLEVLNTPMSQFQKNKQIKVDCY